MDYSSNNTVTNSPKFYLSKHKNLWYYVTISIYDNKTKKNRVNCKSLKTKHKRTALQHFNKYVNGYNDSNNEIVISKNITLPEFYKEITNYLNTNLAKGTVKIYRIAVNNFVRIAGIKHLKLYSIADVENYKTARLNEVTKDTLNIDLSTLKALFNLSVKLNYLNKNIFCGVKKMQIEETNIKVFNENEIKLLLNNIKDESLLNITKFALYSGLRINEILHLQVGNINYNADTISIENKNNFTTKNKRNKIIILNDKLKNLLNRMLYNDANNKSNVFTISSIHPLEKYLFTPENRQHPFCKNYITHKFKRELRKLNFSEYLHFHSLRHTYVSQLINKGISVNIVKELVQHQNIATTMKYVHIDTNILKKYANM